MKKITFLGVLFVFAMSAFVQAQDKALTIAEFASILKSSKNAQILDARSPEEYATNHIKGAINVNLKDEAGTEKIIASLNPKYPTFSYSINNGRSSALAKKLRDKGFDKVYELPGGLGNWVGAGNPLESFTNKDLAISVEQFNQITKSNELVLVDFGSKFCGGCRKLVPVLDSLESKRNTNLKIVRIEFDESTDLVKSQKISALPTLALYKNGEKIWENKGIITYSKLLSAIESKAKLLASK